LIVIGIGVGLFYSTVTSATLTALDPARTGVGGGLTFMFQLVSGAVGVGIATTVFTSASAAMPQHAPGSSRVCMPGSASRRRSPSAGSPRCGGSCGTPAPTSELAPAQASG
jgi:hypothetical protein